MVLLHKKWTVSRCVGKPPSRATNRYLRKSRNADTSLGNPWTLL